MLSRTAESEALARDLAAALPGARVSSGPADRVAYARDLWPRNQIVTRSGVAAPSPPSVVVWPEHTEHVAATISFARARGIPVVPYGAGSGVCGGIQPEPVSIVLDLKRLRRITNVDADLLVAKAQAGIIGQHLEDDLGARGFTLGHFPSSIYCSTLGGWVAGRSAGQCSGRYGKIEDMVLGLTCVDGRGQVLAPSLDGPDAALLPLVIGSEGTLAVVVEATLRIAPAPQGRTFASFSFPSIEAGLECVRRIYQADLRPAVARLYDPFDSMLARRKHHARSAEHTPRRGRRDRGPGLASRLVDRVLRSPGLLNRFVELLPEESFGGTLLVLVWEDAPSIAEAEASAATRIAAETGGKSSGEEPARRWLARRHSVSYRQSPVFAAGGFADTMEVASTWSRLLPMYYSVREALSPHVFVMAHFSHAYPDGASIYFTFAGSAKSDAEALLVYDRAWRDALAAVIGTGGTLSHHHGVGRSKAPAMRKEQGPALDIVRALKREMDPDWILNPGVLIGPEDGAHRDP